MKEPSRDALSRPAVLHRAEGDASLRRSFAFDSYPRPQDGSNIAQEGLKRGPREPYDGPKSAQERSKSAPRGVQETIWGFFIIIIIITH